MKVKIEYKIRNDFDNRFVVSTTIDNVYYNQVSENSFEEAEERLMSELRRKLVRPSVEIPEPKEVEI